jgi:hypothetical protein
MLLSLHMEGGGVRPHRNVGSNDDDASQAHRGARNCDWCVCSRISFNPFGTPTE